MHTVFSLASNIRFNEHGELVVGGDYDPAKEVAYSKEVLLRNSACERLIEVADAVEKQLSIS